MLFRSVWCAGRRVDVRVEGDRIAAVGEELSSVAGEDVLEGGLVCPPFAEPHVHLDATLLGSRTPNRTGTLREGESVSLESAVPSAGRDGFNG